MRLHPVLLIFDERHQHKLAAFAGDSLARNP
jgi:hypothetical protein